MALNNKIMSYLQVNRIRRGMVWGSLLLMALVAFEVFNYSTTEFAMADLLGNLQFAGMRWSTILAIAFCGIDFAGIARLFTPEQNSGEANESWYLFAAWLLAATMNATLTWWGVSIAVASHTTLGSSVLPRETLLKAVPVFVALIVWLIRVLIIGTFSLAGDRLFSQDNRRPSKGMRPAPSRQPQTSRATASLRPASSLPRPASTYTRPAPKPQGNYSRPEPTYQNMSFNGRNQNRNDRYEV